ncbi:uncharacterized protein K460DRAFT_354352 [Cucurbitaria berberidis CBS 394.84]|uniref:Uncharacterized protein n=1 Tax=Cucurbitaria berberidis CBS 394.84 TaxID=1168544 RepID=A0A9P4LBY5_9PLEO|nr:uncharacterized protein K460DRAFT_354352 [Cucurbitaria berberidis CBS 394.84]KAF1849515.1 hypothetical protein K460DRAFT_354352 [Cucurbitaria berberidis CBS 394.84]
MLVPGAKQNAPENVHFSRCCVDLLSDVTYFHVSTPMLQGRMQRGSRLDRMTYFILCAFRAFDGSPRALPRSGSAVGYCSAGWILVQGVQPQIPAVVKYPKHLREHDSSISRLWERFHLDDLALGRRLPGTILPGTIYVVHRPATEGGSATPWEVLAMTLSGLPAAHRCANRFWWQRPRAARKETEEALGNNPRLKLGQVFRGSCKVYGTLNNLAAFYTRRLTLCRHFISSHLLQVSKAYYYCTWIVPEAKTVIYPANASWSPKPTNLRDHLPAMQSRSWQQAANHYHPAPD